MKVITSFDQLSFQLTVAEQKQSISDDAFRESISSWYISPTLFGKIPPDPLSEEFKAFQLSIYGKLTNRAYNVENEETIFNFDHEMLWPYPYGTQSAQTVGTHLMGYGWLIKKMNLPPNSRILEIGSGYGSLTFHLASMGYHVTCLDISASLLDFIKARTSHLPTPVNTICGDMATVNIDDTFDVILFNASLHHSLEHRDVIQRIDRLLSASGIVAFTAEPVVPDNSATVPYPWGIRLDGLSVWSICKWGWLELGFQESYFVRLLKDAGWKLTRQNLGLSGATDVWIATKTDQEASYSETTTTSEGYNVDLESEVIRLKHLVEGYEQGRFIRFMKRLKAR